MLFRSVDSAGAALRGGELGAQGVGVRGSVVQLHRSSVPTHQLCQHADSRGHRHRQVRTHEDSDVYIYLYIHTLELTLKHFPFTLFVELVCHQYI